MEWQWIDRPEGCGSAWLWQAPSLGRPQRGLMIGLCFETACEDVPFRGMTKSTCGTSGVAGLGAWQVTGARVALDAGRAEALDLEIRDGRIHRLHEPGGGSAEPGDEVLELDGRLLLPGLVNAHDHLDFSLFPKLGRGPYPNARVWSDDIYHPTESPVREHLAVPKKDRLVWGGTRNLLGGVTTVCHHNPYDDEVFESGFPVRVVKEFGWAHSLAFDDDVAERFEQTPGDWPFILHLGEGTDAESREEIFQLAEMGALEGRTVLVHGVGLDEAGLELVKQSGASMVWCPSSNSFLLGRTLDDGFWSWGIPTALGTDSSLTADGDLLDEVEAAAQSASRSREGSSLSREALYEMVTTTAAQVLRLRNGEGTLREGGVADFVAVRDTGGRPCDVLVEMGAEGIEMVVVGGRVKLLAERSREVAPGPASRLHRVMVGGVAVLVDADVPRLMASAAAALGDELWLAGKRLLT